MSGGYHWPVDAEVPGSIPEEPIGKLNFHTLALVFSVSSGTRTTVIF